MHSNNHYRPQRSLYDSVTKKLLTLTGFAWFLTAVLSIVLMILFFKSITLGGKEYPYQLVTLSGTHLDMSLRDNRTKGTVVFLYDSKCKTCAKELDSLLNLRSQQENNEISLFFVGMDDDPMETMNFLEEQRVPESMITYYVAPDARINISTVLEHHGTSPITYDFPHTMLFNNRGKLIVEYKGYVRSQEILRTLQLYKIQHPEG